MGYQVIIEKQVMWAIFDIKGDASAAAKRIAPLGLSLPASTNTAKAKDGQHLCWIGGDHWLLLAPTEMENELLERLERLDREKSVERLLPRSLTAKSRV